MVRHMKSFTSSRYGESVACKGLVDNVLGSADPASSYIVPRDFVGICAAIVQPCSAPRSPSAEALATPYFSSEH